MRTIPMLVMAAGLIMAVGAGCASRTTTVERHETIQASPEPRTSSSTTPVTVEHQTTTTTETRDHPQGVLSAMVNFVGEVLSLPFRFIGGLIRAIF